jgi:hypothetical protein
MNIKSKFAINAAMYPLPKERIFFRLASAAPETLL